MSSSLDRALERLYKLSEKQLSEIARGLIRDSPQIERDKHSTSTSLDTLPSRRASFVTELRAHDRFVAARVAKVRLMR